MTAESPDLAGLAARLVAEAGDTAGDVHGSGTALAAAARLLGPRRNRQITLHDAAQLHLPAPTLAAAKVTRHFPPLPADAVLPPGFTHQSHLAETAAVRLQRIPGGHLLHLAHAPVVLTAGADKVVQDHSGRFAPLVNHVTANLRLILDRARMVPGRVFVLGDEIQPPNYCHWLLDALPRLDCLGSTDDCSSVSVAVAPLTAPFQRETLHRCGFDDAHIVELGPMQALRADELLVTSDLPDPPHPAFKAAAWALRFLRRRLGSPDPAGAGAGATPRRIYVSRADSAGRRVVNEDALLAALRPLGFVPVALAGMTVQAQAALFADAEMIVGPHGAGLTNAVFAPPGTGLLELFPRSYGMATYYVLAMGARLTYDDLIFDDVVPGSRAQRDDMRVDVAQVVARCHDMFRRRAAPGG